MHFISIRELRIKPGEVWKRLQSEHDLVLTSNGKPIAVLTDANEDSLERKLDVLRRERLRTAIEHIRSVAHDTGLDKITMEEIDAEIAAVRKAHRNGSKGPR